MLHQEAEYVAEAVLPNLPEYAQVGRLWSVEMTQCPGHIKCYSLLLGILFIACLNVVDTRWRL